MKMIAKNPEATKVSDEEYQWLKVSAR